MARTYPDHIYDKDRIQMVAEFTQKELRKLLPSMPPEAWPRIDSDVENWFDGKRSDIAQVHDFWNGCEGLTQGFKLKRVVRYMSAADISWSKQELDLDLIPLGWAVGTLKDKLGPPTYHAKQIREAFEADPEFLAQNKAMSDKYAGIPAERDHYPIILIKEGAGYTLLDGNRRALRAIIYGKKSLPAYVGESENYHQIRDYWVSTPFLRNLVRVAETGNKESVAAVKVILEQLFAETIIAKINYELRVLDQSPLAKQLFEEITSG